MSRTIRLNSGHEIPRLGLGVYQAARGAETRDAVRIALACGYRHIDTARAYGNERDVGEAIRKSGIARDQIFVTTKLWNSDQGAARARAAYDGSEHQLEVGPLDLYLLHWPVPRARLESWRVLEELVEAGRVRSIGVSNFMVHHLEELLTVAKIKPAVNQIEVSPFLQQRDVRDFCAREGIVVEAYSPLTRGRRLGHRVVRAVAEEVSRTPAQVLIRWALQHDMVVLPKSVQEARIVENADVFGFSLSHAMMQQLDALEEGLVTGWDPRDAP